MRTSRWRPLDRVGYPVRPVSLLACPFCREMYENGEESLCPVCGMELAPIEKLPPSHALRDDDGLPETPERDPLPITYLGRSKGALAAVSFAGMVLFFLPWIDVTLPDVYHLSGFDLARARGWQWGAFVSWLVLVPIVLSRRSITQMRGARLAAAFLSSVSAVTVGIFLSFPQKGGILPVRFTYGWPFWAMLGLSIVGIFFSLRLGGRIDDMPVRRGTSVGQHVH